MEHVHIPLLSLLVFLLNLSSLHFLSLADDYYINCGSHDNANLSTGQNFSGESKSGYSFSKSKAVKDINQLIAPLYKTARGFSKAFYCQFNITQNGTYLVRLHFLAFSSSSNNLSTAVFGVLDSKNFTLLNNFTAKNSTNYPVIKEFFVRIDITDSFRLYFIPQPSSFAFVNAIELFLAPSDFIPENNISNLPLHTIYRLNVGGSTCNDPQGRNWETDDSHLSDPNSAENATPKSELNLNYLPEPVDGLFLSNYTFAPIQVYHTAKHMSNSSSRPAISSNVTWFFSVSRKARHIVRAHFCDIIGQPGEIIFNLYSNGNFRKEIFSNISQHPAVPFYYDFLVNSSESELINITIKPKSESTIPDAFLNGLEILEIVEGLAPIPTVRDSKKNIVAPVVGSVLGGLSLICVLIVGFLFCFRHRKAKKRVETSVWSPMPANGGGSSHGSALNLNYLGLKITFNEIQSATNNFDTKLVIGKGGFGNVYRGTLLNGTKVAVKRAYKRDERGSGSGQGLPEFETEIIVLSKIRHHHLVSLIGYCNERSEMILVYEFMEKGTLRDHLYDSDVPRLSWKQRLEICTGAARGLHYLHTGAAGEISDSPYTIVFDLYSNGNFRKQIVGLDSPFAKALVTPFYYDFVVNATESKLINISIAPNLENTTEQNAFLNGLEILEILEGTALIYNLEESKKVNVALAVGSVLGGGLFLFIIGFMLCLRHRKARKRNRGGISHNLGLKISFAQIRSATNNFDPKMQIGVGGFGYVYKGTLSNGTKVAVKRCKQEGQRSGQGLPEFETEMIVLSKIRHRHLVSLIGYCDEGSEMILVYEFMEKGTLRDHLYESDVPRLSWKQRLEICIGSATGLDYLHKGAAGGIIHRDVKSTNILLDENLVAKVADFGLSRSGPLDETHVSTVVKGTIGYLDPEYMMSQQLTEKSDVYSFGVVLLEVLCGRPAIDITLPREKVNLAEWVVLCKKEGLLEEVIDVSLKGHIDPSSLRHFIETAEKCLQHDSSDRPTMADVLWDLDYTLKLHQTARLGEAHEDSTTTASSAFLLPNIRHFASLGSTVNRADMRDDEMESTESEIFSQLRIGEAR